MNPVRRIFRVAFFLETNPHEDFLAFVGTCFYFIWKGDYGTVRAIKLKSLTAQSPQLGFHSFEAV